METIEKYIDKINNAEDKIEKLKEEIEKTKAEAINFYHPLCVGDVVVGGNMMRVRRLSMNKSHYGWMWEALGVVLDDDGNPGLVSSRWVEPVIINE